MDWYALKVFYNKVFDFEEQMRRRGIESYFPVRREEVKGEAYLRFRREMALSPGEDVLGSRYIFEEPHLYKRIPLVSSLLFIHCEKAELKGVREDIEGKGFVYMNADWTAPARISEKEMAAFRLVADSGASGLEFFSEDPITRFKAGARVRVKDGPLKGAEGYIKRIKKDRRLLVAIAGVVAVATTYIPPSELEIVEEAAEA